MEATTAKRTVLALGLACAASTAFVRQAAAAGADDSAELAKKLSNPIASLISVPLELNRDTGIGTASGPDWVLSFTVTFLFAK